jgi:hypothetical protein
MESPDISSLKANMLNNGKDPATTGPAALNSLPSADQQLYQQYLN